jgi:hypothetical protein
VLVARLIYSHNHSFWDRRREYHKVACNSNRKGERKCSYQYFCWKKKISKIIFDLLIFRVVDVTSVSSSVFTFITIQSNHVYVIQSIMKFIVAELKTYGPSKSKDAVIPCAKPTMFMDEKALFL